MQTKTFWELDLVADADTAVLLQLRAGRRQILLSVHILKLQQTQVRTNTFGRKLIRYECGQMVIELEIELHRSYCRFTIETQMSANVLPDIAFVEKSRNNGTEYSGNVKFALKE